MQLRDTAGARTAQPCAWLLALVSVFATGGCMVGPDYQAPAMPAGQSFSHAPADATDPNAAALATWWRALGDPILDDLIDRAIEANHDLRIAEANYKEARALRRLAVFDLAPAVRADAGYSTGLLSETAAPGLSRDEREVEYFDAGFDATWELDVFGRVRRSVQAADAGLAAAAALRDDVRVVMCAEVVRGYFELRGFQQQLAVARRNADVQRETLSITQARLEGGRGTEFDVARSRSQLGLTLSTVPSIESAIELTLHRLAVLIGQPPTVLVATLSAPTPLPAGFPPLAVGEPAELLRRRPDVRSVERLLASTTAQVGIVTADLFPRVTIHGSIGLEAGSISALGDSGSDTWAFGPRITWAAFDIGRVRARIQAADARTEAALARYEQVVLAALEETEGALMLFGREQARQVLLRESAAASETAAELARRRYEAGATEFISVLDSERTLLEAQDRLAASQTRTALAYVAVQKALGGGAPVVETR